MGTDTVLDVPMGNVQRETFNSQLSTGLPKGRMVGWIWGQTRNLDDRTFEPADLNRTSSGRAIQAGCGGEIWGQTRCSMCRWRTFNVKR